MTTTLRSFIEAQEADLAPLNTKANALYWSFATTGEAEYERELGEVIRRLRLMSAEPERLETLERLMADDDLHDPLLARQATLLRNTFRGSRMTPDLIEAITDLELKVQETFTNFRAEVAGRHVTDNELRGLLRDSDNPADRKQAWLATRQIGAHVAPQVRELARLRNRGAQQCGFPDYYVMQLELQELSEGEVFGLFDELERGTADAWTAYKGALDAKLAKRFSIDPSALRPWHYGDPFFQEAQPSELNLDAYFAGADLEAVTRAYFSAIGLDVGDVLARSDLYERAGKEQHAFCIHIDRQGDVRVLSNNRPDEYWADTMLHEFGHAAYDKFIDRGLPYFLREPAHTLATEAIAILSGSLIRDDAWLARYVGAPRDEARALRARLREAERHQRLIFSRWAYVMQHFERALYRDPEQELAAVWWDCVSRYQGLARPEERDPHDWAAKIHIGTVPVYYHNYLLGAMIAAQLEDTLRNDVAGGDADAYVGDPRIGGYLVERVFAPGAGRDWRGWLAHATGTALSAAPYARLLSAA